MKSFSLFLLFSLGFVTFISLSSCSKKADYVSQDLSTFNLRGPVISVYSTYFLTNSEYQEQIGDLMAGREIHFDPAKDYSIERHGMSSIGCGMVSDYKDKIRTIISRSFGASSFNWRQISRNEEGWIISVSCEDRDMGLAYENNRLDILSLSIDRNYYRRGHSSDNIEYFTIDYKYDSDGNEIESYITLILGENSDMIQLEYQNVEYDEYGNWTSRCAKGHLWDSTGEETVFNYKENREIEYSLKSIE